LNDPFLMALAITAKSINTNERLIHCIKKMSMSFFFLLACYENKHTSIKKINIFPHSVKFIGMFEYMMNLLLGNDFDLKKLKKKLSYCSQ